MQWRADTITPAHRVCLLVLLLFGAVAEAAEIPSRAPSADGKGELCEWKAKDGLAYRYRLPAGYDPAKGANLTLILHGSNLTKGWGFANHSAKSFRPDDIVVSPDGTTSNGRGGFNFLGQSKDAKRLKALLDELKSTLKVRRTYLYGHSQGSFFAFYFAGLHPSYVDGVVGHASGTWKGTAMGKKGFHQALVFMHGTQDPVVPYDQSVWGYAGYVKAKYPMIRLCSLEGWNHWPAEHNGPVPHTSQQLAWCEGMTCDDPERLAACYDVLIANKSRERHDYAALHSLCERILAMKTPPAGLADRATAAKAVVENLALQHKMALVSVVPKDATLDGAAWIGHLPIFLRAFQGVPACEEVRETWAKVLGKHEKHALKHMRKYWPARKGDKDDAFKAGAAAIEKGFLHYLCWDGDFRKNLKDWRASADSIGLRKGDTKGYDEWGPRFDAGIKAGYAAFDAINKEHANLP